MTKRNKRTLARVTVDKILLGYEVGTGEPVFIPLHHLVVTGTTQLSGKTTTLEALISRSEMTSIAFRTKRGEGSFRLPSVHLHEPFFRERADWQYVAGLLEATMRERMRFERSWIINASKGATSLRDVFDNVVTQLKTAKGLNASVLTTLQAYLEIVVPQIEKIDFARKLDLKPGLNVMNLVGLQDEVQQLVIASTLEELHKSATSTVVVIPEAWKFVPEGRSTPVKYPLEAIARQGAGVGVYVFLDSQDITGVDKAILKQVDTWLIGRQREKNEVERAIAQLPLPKKQRPKPDEIMNLPLGHFVVASRDMVKTVYVKPAWLSDDIAIKVARTGSVILAVARRPSPPGEMKEEGVAKMKMEEQERQFQTDSQLVRENRALRARVEELEREARAHAAVPRDRSRRAVASDPAVDEEERSRYDLNVDVGVATLTVRERVVVINATGEDEKGRLAILIADGFFDSPRLKGAACGEFASRGWGKWSSGPAYAKMERLLIEMASMGFLRNEGKTFTVTPEAKLRIKRVKERG